MTRNIDEIKYLTRFFRSLQGLRLLPLGVWVLLDGFNLFDSPWWRAFEADFPFATLTLVILLLVACGIIGMYYDSSYGDVVKQKLSAAEKKFISGHAILILAAMQIDVMYDLPFNATILVFGLGMIYENATGLRQNMLYAGAVAMIALSLIFPWGAGESYPGSFLALCGLFMIATGIYFHIQFVRRFRAIRQNLAGQG